MEKLVAAFAAVSRILATYPAISTALVSFGVVVAAFFGLSITGDQLIYVVGIVVTLGGLLVHSNVVPMIRAKVTGATGATAVKTAGPATVVAANVTGVKTADLGSQIVEGIKKGIKKGSVSVV